MCTILTANKAHTPPPSQSTADCSALSASAHNWPPAARRGPSNTGWRGVCVKWKTRSDERAREGARRAQRAGTKGEKVISICSQFATSCTRAASQQTVEGLRRASGSVLGLQQQAVAVQPPLTPPLASPRTSRSDEVQVSAQSRAGSTQQSRWHNEGRRELPLGQGAGAPPLHYKSQEPQA